ncbi:hypothetical protein HDU87_006709 [Geranomyces variabilis]|uniref:Protein kinase domain-containing protein n=1 Tax=Geranomyces variabilis TaxID=109894 RepID=A0AAD5TUK1_9FUNG|nr:hypothetical protein HDU87_006709 [Geranomyces variabilis]
MSPDPASSSLSSSSSSSLHGGISKHKDSADSDSPPLDSRSSHKKATSSTSTSSGGGGGWLSSLFHSLAVSLGANNNASPSSSSSSPSASPSSARISRSTKHSSSSSHRTSDRSLNEKQQTSATSGASASVGGHSNSNSTSNSTSTTTGPRRESDPSDRKRSQHQQHNSAAAAPAPAAPAPATATASAAVASSRHQAETMQSLSTAAKSAARGVRWDEQNVKEQKQQAAQRHPQIPEAPPYVVFATSKDWKSPPIAAYPYMNRYRLIGKMGEGAFSTVYRAIDSKTNLLVALKLVSKNQLNETQRSNILRETTLLRRIKHGNIIRLVDFHETPLHYALALELMSGGEIFHQLVSQVCFSEPVCRHVILQVAEGLRYLHEELGVVHRDIKLENLLFEPIPANLAAQHRRPEGLDPNVEADYIPGVGGAGIGLVKIADFGLSKVVFNATTKTPCGTVGYTAPEILNDQRYSKGVDMWALGCVLYTILSGFPPFFDDDPRGLTEKVANGQFAFLSPWWDDISAEAKDLICHLLQVNPKKRYTISQFLAHPWIQGGTMNPTHATPAAAPDVHVEDDEEEAFSQLAAREPNTAKYGDWRDLELPDVLQTPMDEYYTGNEDPLFAAAVGTGRDHMSSVARDSGAGAPHAPPAAAAAAPSGDHKVPSSQPQQQQQQQQLISGSAAVAKRAVHGGAAVPLDTPTYRKLRTPHPVPDGITKEMLAAPFQVYQSIAEGETRPEHIGVVRGGVVPHQRKGSPLAGVNAGAPEVAMQSGGGGGAVRMSNRAKAAKRSGQGFELEMANSRLFNRRRGVEVGNV